MKKTAAALLLLAFVLLSCAGSSSDEAEDPREVMKISTWLLDRNLEGKGQIGFIPESEKTYPRKEDGSLFWVPDEEGADVPNEDLFVFEPLEEGVTRIMAPMTLYMARSGGNIGYTNLNLFVDYDGIVKVTKVDPTDSSIRLRYSLNGIPEEAEGIEINGPCGINICPVGKELASEATSVLVAQDTLVGKEYTLRIEALTLGGKNVATAVVKLTAVPDPLYPWETVHEGQYRELFRSGEERTRFCSVELVSYTFNEMAILSGELSGPED